MLLSSKPSGGMCLVALLAFAGCGSSAKSLAEQDAAVTEGDVATVAEAGQTPQTAPTLETGIDLATFVAAVKAQVIPVLSSAQPDTPTDDIQVGRPWGQFDVHKGPRLVFRGSWRVLVANGGDYVTVAGVVRDGDGYKLISVGSIQFIPTMVEREQIPAVSAALDRGRAAFLRRITDGGDAFLAYETGEVADADQPEIRVQPLGLQGLAGVTLAEFEGTLPAE
jgi:hypothetical protein